MIKIMNNMPISNTISNCWDGKEFKLLTCPLILVSEMGKQYG
jgi:hypothetical protein